jgi:DNA-binding HxlR family transcriptional regulator
MMGITVQEFLQKKGAIGLLALLHERPKMYTEIESEIEITSDTILKRRAEAANIGLIDISLGEDSGTKKIYHLTDMGEALTDKMAREGLVSNYRKMRTLEQLVEEQRDTIVTWAGENPSQLLQYREAQGGTTIPEQTPPPPAAEDTDSEASGGEQEEASDESDEDSESTERVAERPTAGKDRDSNQGDSSNRKQGNLSEVISPDSDSEDPTEE